MNGREGGASSRKKRQKMTDEGERAAEKIMFFTQMYLFSSWFLMKP